MAPNLSIRQSGLNAKSFHSSNPFPLQKRQIDRWSFEEQYELGQVADENGVFNGTCTSLSQSGLPPRTESGECASYYDDVTVYCCGALGGMIVNLIQPTQSDPNADGEIDVNVTTTTTTPSSSTSSSSSSSSSASSTNTLIEPSCETDNYNDMLLCYKYTAEEHCRSGADGPWGVCNVKKTSSNSMSNAAANSANSNHLSKTKIVLSMFVLFVILTNL